MGGARVWAGALSVDFEGDIFDDWRLPATVNGPLVSGYDGTTTVGYNITNSEMGHLFYTELENLGKIATDGTNPQPGWGLSYTGDFQSLIPHGYWSGTSSVAADVFGQAWRFNFGNGFQDVGGTSFTVGAMAVRDGDVAAAEAVPEPTTVVLLGIGLAGMAMYGARKRRQRRQFDPGEIEIIR